MEKYRNKFKLQVVNDYLKGQRRALSISPLKIGIQKY